MGNAGESGATVDGRRARRERGRAAVIDAMFHLLQEGSIPPKTEEVAARAGVSEASIFRYFDGLDDLREQAVADFQHRFAHLLDVDGHGDRITRITAFVRSRVDYFERVAPILTVGRARAISVGDHRSVATMRTLHSDQVRRQFAIELRGASPTRGADLISTIDTATSPEAWDTLRVHYGRTREQIRRSWVRNVESLIAAWETHR